MEAVGGLVTLSNLALCIAIGVKLARLGQRSRGPEIGLAIYFLLAGGVGIAASSFLYMGWTDPSLALPESVSTPLHVVALLGSNAGLLALYVFTWRTFRKRSRIARIVVASAFGALLISMAGLALVEGFAVQVLPGPIYWLGWAVRCAALPWLAIESLLYWTVLSRRLRLGLVDPLVTNRFLLLSVWSGAMFGMGLADPLARVWYVAVAGSTDVWVPEVAHSIVLAMVSVTAVLGLIVAATLFLAFFPTATFRRFLTARATAIAPASLRRPRSVATR
jgi:hypothetical protein